MLLSFKVIYSNNTYCLAVYFVVHIAQVYHADIIYNNYYDCRLPYPLVYEQ